MFELLGCTCVADDAAPAACWVDASCCDDWTPLPPARDCVAVCVVGAVFAAVPVDAASFDCVEPGSMLVPVRPPPRCRGRCGLHRAGEDVVRR